MKIQDLATRAAHDVLVYTRDHDEPVIGDYCGLPGGQHLQIFRTTVHLSPELLEGRPTLAIMEAKKEAYLKHVSLIEHALMHSRRGFILEDEDGAMSWMPWVGNQDFVIPENKGVAGRTMAGFWQMQSESEWPLFDAEPGLIYLRNRALIWVKHGFDIHTGFERFEWVSEVALGFENDGGIWDPPPEPDARPKLFPRL